MAFVMFNEGADSLLDASINWASDTIRVRLVTTAASIDKDATAMTGIGVTGYDQTLSGKGRAKDTGTDRVNYTANNFTFPAVPLGTGECNRVCVFKFVTNDAASIPICVVDIAPVTPNGGDVAVTGATTSLFYSQQ